MKRTLAPLALAAAGACLLTSCSGSSEADASPTKTATHINYNGTYLDAEHLRDAYLEAGHDCSPTTQSKTEHTFRIDCDEDHSLIVRTDSAEVPQAIGLGLMDNDYVLSGKNWVVQSSHESDLQRLQGSLGGDIDDPTIKAKLGTGEGQSLNPNRWYDSVSDLRDMYNEAGFDCTEGYSAADASWQCEDGTYLMTMPERFSTAGATATSMLDDQLPAKSQNYIRLKNAAIVSPDRNHLIHVAGYFGGFPKDWK